ncbi:2'-5' RNA ligase family protein [Desertivirga xinjiangensis]|uniref:2'-5' RNA ligase family protein n=1 Tax=Desertivirga xinjiangensis TaxID=539206 RepID=UPI00210ADE5F|nr:2'-5' RNA ligase family protein [Pedobacter xinjiangensis]
MKSAINNQLALFDTQNYEFNILISPTYRIKNYVYNFKQQINERIGLDAKNLYSVPHISLFKMESVDNEDYILENFKQALLYSKRFKVELNGVGFFKHGESKKSVFLNIVNPEPIVHIYKRLLSAFRLKERPFMPRLTVVKAIANSKMNKIEYDLSKYNYHDNFFCTKVTVLKKPINDDPDTKYVKIYEALLN